MVRAGWSPSVRLFEAAACAVPAISDPWAGLESFFVPGEEILVAASSDEAIEHLVRTSAAERRAIGAAARRRVLAEHTARHRVEQLEALVGGLVGARA
jgi:spore maturation protein CgeB